MMDEARREYVRVRVWGGAAEGVRVAAGETPDVVPLFRLALMNAFLHGTLPIPMWTSSLHTWLPHTTSEDLNAASTFRSRDHDSQQEVQQSGRVAHA